MHGRVYTVDWRPQFAALQQYLMGRGGVIHVRLGAGSPASEFARVLRGRMTREEWPFAWLSVQVDPSNASTHYLADVVIQIRKSLGLPVPEAKQYLNSGVSIANDIEAGGNVEIQDIEIRIESDPYQAVMRDYDEIGRLCDSLETVLSSGRVALLFLESHNYTKFQLRKLRQAFWDDALSKLTQFGLLLIDFSDPRQLDATVWPPDPCLVLDLPDKYDDDSREDARGDLFRIAIDEGLFPTDDGAMAFATTVLATSNDIADVHVRLGLAVARLGGQNGR